MGRDLRVGGGGVSAAKLRSQRGVYISETNDPLLPRLKRRSNIIQQLLLDER
jgi:hypothetical protein